LSKHDIFAIYLHRTGALAGPPHMMVALRRRRLGGPSPERSFPAPLPSRRFRCCLLFPRGPGIGSGRGCPHPGWVLRVRFGRSTNRA